MRALINAEPKIKNKTFVVRNPPALKPMPMKRLLNQVKKQAGEMVNRVSAPLSEEEIKYLIKQAYGPDPIIYRNPGHEEDSQKKLRCLSNRLNRCQGWFHELSKRFVQRRYRVLLRNHYIPIISLDANSEWRVRNSNSILKPPYATLSPSFLEGYTSSTGATVGQIDKEGKFIARS
jgi:hypothetical protein